MDTVVRISTDRGCVLELKVSGKLDCAQYILVKELLKPSDEVRKATQYLGG